MKYGKLGYVLGCFALSGRGALNRCENLKAIKTFWSGNLQPSVRKLSESKVMGPLSEKCSKNTKEWPRTKLWTTRSGPLLALFWNLCNIYEIRWNMQPESSLLKKSTCWQMQSLIESYRNCLQWLPPKATKHKIKGPIFFALVICFII